MNEDLTTLKNIGPKSAARLRRIGITSRAQIEELGAIAVFKRMRETYPASANMLWALQGALLDLQWNQLPPEVKSALLDELGE